MHRSATLWTLIALGALLLAPSAAAHESYQSDDGKYILVLGEQNEPVYTYDWTNLDFIVSEDPVNGTGDRVAGVNGTVSATLIAPGGEELSMEIEPQHGQVGRYQFVHDYFLTQGGQYQVRLEGHINGTDVTGTYDLPGPREPMDGHGFPAENVPSLLELKDENDRLRERIAALEQALSDLETQIADLEGASDAGDGAESAGEASTQGAPGFGALALIGALAIAGAVLGRRA